MPLVFIGLGVLTLALIVKSRSAPAAPPPPPTPLPPTPATMPAQTPAAPSAGSSGNPVIDQWLASLGKGALMTGAGVIGNAIGQGADLFAGGGAPADPLGTTEEYTADGTTAGQIALGSRRQVFTQWGPVMLIMTPHGWLPELYRGGQ